MVSVRFPYSSTSIYIQFRNGIPAIASTRNCTELYGIPTDSGILGIGSNSGIARNSQELLPIPEFRELIPIPEFWELIPIPELLTGITRLPSPSCILICLNVIPSEHSPIPVRDYGSRIETELRRILRNSYRFRNSGNS
jgi:hypothetical protein